MKHVYPILVMICVSVLSMSALAAVWEVPGDFATIQDAIDDPEVYDGDRIMVAPGEHAGALVDKSVEIKGESGAIIISGPAHPSGLSQGFRLATGGDGATISHLKFTTDLSIMNGDGVDNVTVTQCTFENSIQAISNWRGSNWEISHNQITNLRTRCGGGIGVLVADFAGGTVTGNVVSHNKVVGTLNVAADDCGGYNGSGIVLYADFRWDRQGTMDMSSNRVVKNKVSMSSSNADVVDIVAIELTDTDGNVDRITGNAIGFNDLRATALQIVLTPEGLDNDVNDISRNLGENRGHGLHPNLFGPGGN